MMGDEREGGKIGQKAAVVTTGGDAGRLGLE